MATDVLIACYSRFPASIPSNSNKTIAGGAGEPIPHRRQPIPTTSPRDE
jgi:hypothetical protein